MATVGRGVREIRTRLARVPDCLRGEVRRCRLRFSLLPEEDAEDQQADLDLATKRYREIVKGIGR